MEKKIKIYYSEYGALSRVEEHESAPVGVNLAALEKFYAEMGERHKKQFDKFAEYWEREGFEKLFNPAARVVTMPVAVAEENFGAELLRVNDSVSEVVMTVWTTGPELERECTELMNSRGSLMTGFLLDVAGSVALYDMHAALDRWVKENPAAKLGKFVNGEFYPGMGSMRQDLMEKVVTLGETEKIIGVGASGLSLLRPRKSQCSFVALGSAEHEAVFKSEPCKPCAGKKCLYYQLGGCHMQAEL